MSDQSVEAFIEYLKNNPDVRAKVEQLEEAMKAASVAGAKSIAVVAADAGFDIQSWDMRPGGDEPVASGFISCGIFTSRIVAAALKF